MATASNMSLYEREILGGLEKVPTPHFPGTLIVEGLKSQPVLTIKQTGETIIAASQYGKGRLLVGAHTFYMDWFLKNLVDEEKHNAKKNQVIDAFVKNVKLWLVHGDEKVAHQLDMSLVCDLNKALNKASTIPLKNYKVLLFHAESELDAKQERQLLAYLENGGSVLAASTPWGYLQTHPDNSLEDMSLYRFLRDRIGITMTPDGLSLGVDELDLKNNRAKRSPSLSPPAKDLVNPREKASKSADNQPLPSESANLTAADKRPNLEKHRQQGSSNFAQEIRECIGKLPIPRHHGAVAVTGQYGQTMLTLRKTGETIIAASQYGKGRLLVGAHSLYMKWFVKSLEQAQAFKTNSDIASYVKTVKLWFVHGDENVARKLDMSLVCEVNEALANRSQFPLQNYKVLLFDAECELTARQERQLLAYMENGGGVLAAATPKDYLQAHPDKSLDDMSLFRFLRDHFEITFTHDMTNTNEHDESNKSTNSYESSIESDDDSQPDDTDVCMFFGLMSFEEGEKAPGIKQFPGDFKQKPVLEERRRVTISTAFSERVSTGLYLPAGVQLQLTVNEGDVSGWMLRIGAHTDKLSDCDKLTRWPSVTVERQLSKNMSMSSPFGGLVFLESPASGGSLKLTLSNVCEAPFVDVQQSETVNDWMRRREAPGLWAELAGRNIIFTTPSDCVRHLGAVEVLAVLNFWDRIVDIHHELRGTSASDQRRERVVNDIQPSGGYMHSGYPVVTDLDCCQREDATCLFDIEKLTEPFKSADADNCLYWGMFEELAHNMQRSEWMFDDTGDVTVMLFSMHVVYKMSGGTPVYKQQWLMDQAGKFEKFFADQPTYERWQGNYGMKLVTFASLIKHFGWPAMKTFLKNYERDINNPNARNMLPVTNQDKIDQWVIRYSRIVQRNIKPHFQMFGLPVSSSVDARVAHLPGWCVENEKKAKVFFSDVIAPDAVCSVTKTTKS